MELTLPKTSDKALNTNILNENMTKDILFPFIVLALSLHGCTVDIYPNMAASHKSDGEVTFVYTYGGDLVTPRVHWEQAMEKASNKCREWGYESAALYEQGVKECLGFNSSGNCRSWQIKHRAYCTDEKSDRLKSGLRMKDPN